MVVSKTGVKPQSANSRILMKASEVGKSATIVFGKSGSGKSSLILNTLIETEHEKVLWLALNNTGVLDDLSTEKAKAIEDWDFAVVNDWPSFLKDYVQAAEKGELSGYSALVIDGGNKLANFCLKHIAPGGAATQADWYKMGNALQEALVSLRSTFSEIWFAIDVVDEADGSRKIDMNPHSRNLVMPIFARKWYTTVRVAKDAQNPKGVVTYSVQKNPALAIDLISA